VPYRIEYDPSAVRALRKLSTSLQRRIIAKIETLADNPRPPSAIKMSGHDVYRLRVGDYRVIYAIADEQLVVLVVEIGHRRDIYRDW
jgi:mRNA interferase RelE/StbE